MTNFAWQVKFGIGLIVLLLLAVSLGLWLNTPDLFVYFNLAFCAH
ncbi:hypothetical protein [Acinetobacter sp. B51(2017)]|nr:hypothetical protein [Acinetobacter sp. B51(2017)]